MVFIGISKDGDENRRGGGKMRHTKLVKTTSSHIIMLPTIGDV